MIAHLRLTVPSTRRSGARSKRAQLTSPVLTAVGRAPCSPTPSGAFIAVTSSTVHLARTRGAPFSPPSLFRTCREAMGRLPRPPGRAPCRLRTTRTDAPRPTRIPYTSAGAPRASHDRPRTTDGRRARRTEVRPARKQTFPLAAPRHGSLEHILFLTPSPSPTASPASRSRHQPLTSPHSPHSRRETSSEACARAPPPRSRQARRGDLHRCAQRPPLFHPLNLQTSRWKRVPRLTLAPAGRLEPEGAAACVSTPGASLTR